MRSGRFVDDDREPRAIFAGLDQTDGVGRAAHAEASLSNATQEATLPAYGFAETSFFTKRVAKYFETDEDYARFQLWLAANPRVGSVIRGTGGVRKVRWQDPRRGKGKRGGTRVIHFIIHEDRVILLLPIYDKKEAADVTAPARNALSRLVDEEVEHRRARREGSAQ